MTLLAAGVLMGLAACAKDEEKEEHPGQGRLIASVGEMPAALQQVFRLYPEGEASSDLQQKEGRWNVDEWLPVKNYDMAVAGFDASEVELSGGNTIGEACLQVRRAVGADLLPSLAQPVLLATALDCSIEEGKTCSLDLQPRDLRRVLRLTVDAGSADALGELSGTLSGIARSVSLPTARPQNGAKLALELSSLGGGRYEATAGILGVAPGEGEGSGNKLSLTFVTATGGQISVEEDLTEALAEAAATGRDTLAVGVAINAFVPIRLYTAIRTRAVVNEFDGTPVAIAAGTASGLYAGSWEGTATGGEIVLAPRRYYPADGSPLYLRGYYPVAPLQNGTVQYTLTGQEDLMLSVEQSGSLDRHFDAVMSPLTYSHLLTQLNFTLRLEDVSSGYKVRSVKLKGLASTAVVDLVTGAIEAIGNAAPVVIYTDPGTGGFPIVDGVATLPGYVLVQPEASFTLDLVLAVDGNPAHDLSFPDLPVRFAGEGGQGGSAYNVEISVKAPGPTPGPDPDPVPDPDPDPDPNPGPGPDPGPEPEPPVKDAVRVEVTATITAWNAGDSGNAEM